jgi:hypothetical protein
MKIYIDEAEYIKARLFDMLIGDWNRNEDQWRWKRIYKKKIVYKPNSKRSRSSFKI